MSGVTLETERLILRPPLIADFAAWASAHEDADAMRFIGGAQPRSVSWRGFAATAGGWTLQGFAMFSIIERATGRWIGRAGPHFPECWPGTEVGWSLVREAWGQGYATEAAAASMAWAFGHLGWSEVIHCIDPDNHASQAVARRLGSSVLRRAKLPPPVQGPEVDIWGQTREAWAARA